MSMVKQQQKKSPEREREEQQQHLPPSLNEADTANDRIRSQNLKLWLAVRLAVRKKPLPRSFVRSLAHSKVETAFLVSDCWDRPEGDDALGLEPKART